MRLGEIPRRSTDASADVEHAQTAREAQIVRETSRRRVRAKVVLVGVGKIAAREPFDIPAACGHGVEDRPFERSVPVLVRDLLFGRH